MREIIKPSDIVAESPTRHFIRGALLIMCEATGRSLLDVYATGECLTIEVCMKPGGSIEVDVKVGGQDVSTKEFLENL